MVITITHWHHQRIICFWCRSYPTTNIDQHRHSGEAHGVALSLLGGGRSALTLAKYWLFFWVVLILCFCLNCAILVSPLLSVYFSVFCPIQLTWDLFHATVCGKIDRGENSPCWLGYSIFRKAFFWGIFIIISFLVAITHACHQVCEGDVIRAGGTVVDPDSGCLHCQLSHYVALSTVHCQLSHCVVCI